MLTHIVHHIFRTVWSTNFKRGTRMEDDDPHQPHAPWPPMSTVTVTRSRDQSEPSCANAVPVSLEAGGAYRVGRTRRPRCLLHYTVQFLLTDWRRISSCYNLWVPVRVAQSLTRSPVRFAYEITPFVSTTRNNMNRLNFTKYCATIMS